MFRELSTAAKTLGPLYRATFLFGLACGISIALTPLVLHDLGYDKQEIGTLALFFALGLVIFAVPVGSVLRHVGGKVTLTTSLVGYCICVGLFPFMTSFWGLASVRFFDGIFSIGVWVSSETILLARADKKNKGHLTSLYAIWLACGYVVGPVMATLLARSLSSSELFLLAAGLACLSAVYVKTALDPVPLDGEPHRARSDTAEEPNEEGGSDSLDTALPSSAQPLRLGTILLRIKTSCFAALCYGYFQASVVLFLPLYLIESKGVDRDNTILLPGLFCLGMLVFSNVAGRLGDRHGHLRLVTILAAAGTLSVLGFVFVDQFPAMCALVFLAGATFASMSPVALALVGVVIPKAQLSRANAFYNTMYASGMLLGPITSSMIFSRFGGPAMLYHLAALWTAFVLFCLVFSLDDPAVHKTTPSSSRPLSA